MRQSISRELLAYWNILRRGRAAPERLEIDPGVIRSLLADTFILEHDPAAGFPFRLSGTRNNMLFDRELRLESFTDLWHAADRRQIVKIIEAVSSDSLPIIAGLETEREGRCLNLELLLLPLRHHGQTHSRLLGCLTPMNVPDWLGLFPVGPLKLKSFRVIDPAALNETSPQHGWNPVDIVPIFERRKAFTSVQPSGVRKLRHLTLYNGGR